MIKKMILILFSLFFISCNNQNIYQLYADWGFFNLEQNIFPFEQLQLKNKEKIKYVEFLEKGYKYIQYFETSRVSKIVECIYDCGDSALGEAGSGMFSTEVFYNTDGNLSEVKYYMGDIAAENLYSEPASGGVVSETVSEDSPVNTDPALGRYIGRFKITHYAPGAADNGIWGNATAWAGDINPGQTIAVDPNVIPKLSWVYIEDYGFRRAEDCGGAVKGYHIDMAVSTHSEAMRLGVVYKDVYMAE